MSIARSSAWQDLKQHAREVRRLHLRDLLQESGRFKALSTFFGNIVLDSSRQNATETTWAKLLKLAEQADLSGKIQAMFKGEHINGTEDRAVLHVALRAEAGASFKDQGVNVVPEVHRVLDQIKQFSEAVRKGRRKGATGAKLTDVVAIGIGGSYLGPEFVAEALATEKNAAKAAMGRRLRFLANVDPIDVARALADLDPARTLVVIVSKTFTTAETMLNARTVRQWLVKTLGEKAVRKHMVAVSTNLEAVEAFGIDPANAFGFWDWVGGRYSVCSAVGMLPLSLQYGFAQMEQFLAGARAMDQHFRKAAPEKNLPVQLGLWGVWNSSFLGHTSRALLPYCQALHKFAAHIQQVDMESNGKRVDLDGKPLTFEAGEIDFGEPGTNGQHSFYQLVHQGRVVPADFIGFTESQNPTKVPGYPVSNHDELMANFFAQPDALAVGKTATELRDAGVDPLLVPHKVFPGNRPSQVLLFKGRLDAYNAGQLLALYEHRTAVQGFLWGINSFDQMGVELGKVLATTVREQLASSRKKKPAPIKGFNPSTTALLKTYLKG